METEVYFDNHPERAKASGHQLVNVITGDVLHDFAAAACDRAVSEHHGHADDEIAEAAVPQAQASAVVRGHNAAHRSVIGPQRIKRHHLTMLMQLSLHRSPG